MKSVIYFASVLLFTSSAWLSAAHADAFEDKLAAEQSRLDLAARAQAYSDQSARLNRLNNQILSKIPGGATVSKCKTHRSYFTWDKAMTTWNGLALEIGAEENPNGSGLPPQLGGCHYRDNKTGLDCKIEGYAIGRNGYTKFDKVCL